MKTKTLSSAIKKVAISYIFIYVHINISAIDILPDWLGYFMIVSALPVLSEKEQSAQLLRPFGIAIGIWNIINCVLKITAAQWNLTLIGFLFSIVTIYFHFQLITNIANLDIEQQKRKRLLALRTATVLLHTVLTLSLILPTIIDEEFYSYIILFIVIPQLVICFWIAGELFKISKILKEKEAEAFQLAESIGEAEHDTDAF